MSDFEMEIPSVETGFSGGEGDLDQRRDFEKMTFADMESQPVGSPIERILQDSALFYLRTKDREWFFENFTGKLDLDGYLLRRDESSPNFKPSQCITGGIPEVLAMAKDSLREYFSNKNTFQPDAAKADDSQEQKVSTEPFVVSQESIAGPDFIFDELRYQISKEVPRRARDSLQESFIFDSISIGDVERGIDVKGASEELVWVSVDAIVGRPGADEQKEGWAHEYSNRKGLIENVAQSIREGNDESLEQAFHVRYGKGHRIQLVALDGPRGPMYCVKDGTHRVAGSKLSGLQEIPAMVCRPKFPLEYDNYDEDQARDIQRKIERNLIKGRIKTEERGGKTFFTYILEKEVLPWIHIKEGLNAKAAKMYERMYPGSLDHIVLLNGEEIPRDALVDDMAFDYFVSGRWNEWIQKFSGNRRDDFGVVIY